MYILEDLISVIIPVYNVEPYISKCIESVISQTYNNLEIIIIDDGSTDKSGLICDLYSKRDSRIKVIHKENEGLVRARKEGILVSAGKYIGYVDGDDWIEPNMYEMLYQSMINESVDVTMCGRIEEYGEVHKYVRQGFKAGKYDRKRLVEEIFPRFIVNNNFFEWGIFPNLWDKLFKKEYIEDYQLKVNDIIKMGEDAACVYPCLLNVQSIYIMDECYYHYRQISTSMVRVNGQVEEERNNYYVLYNSVKETLLKSIHICDVTEQWRKYVLFLMIPRSDSLYDGMEELSYLFPYKNIKRNADVLLYGMGVYGQRLYKYLMRTGFCRVVATFDMNYKNICISGCTVLSPDKIAEFKCNNIIIACSFYNTRMKIFDNLKKKYPEKNICIINEDITQDREVWKALRLD